MPFLFQPDFRDIRYGVSVWAGGIDYFSKRVGRKAHRGALKFFVSHLPRISREFLPPSAPECGLTSNRLEKMLRGVRVQWKRGPIRRWRYWGWSAVDIAGAQKRNTIVLRWQETISMSALFHELQHMVDEVVFGRYDPKHQNEPWWRLTLKLKQEANASGATL